jgi:receptor protein-tyrosine kinase
MLGSRNMRLLVEDLRRRYDYVIIDAPPLLAVTDAAVLTAVADGSVISTRYGKTRREELEEAANALERIEAPLLGVILNRVPQAAGAARGYGYAYGYEADPGRQTTGVVRPLASARSERGRRAQSADTGPLEAVPTRR